MTKLLRNSFRQGTQTFIEKSRSALSFTQSEKEENSDDSVDCVNDNKMTTKESKSGWTEHTWSTFIERSVDLEEDKGKPRGKQLLSSFQIVKFTHFFYHVLDLNSDHVISQEDFDGLNSRVRHYMDWTSNNPQYLKLYEVHSLFIEHFLSNAESIVDKEDGFDFGEPSADTDEENCEKTDISIDNWVNVWGDIVGNAKKPDDLPMWLQYYPKTLFETINRTGSGVISKKELKLFYTAFLDAGKLGDEALTDLTDKSYSAMTANEDIELTLQTYQLCFLNFLLGKQPNGPGQFMFGKVVCEEKSNWISADLEAISVDLDQKSKEANETNSKQAKFRRKSVVV